MTIFQSVEPGNVERKTIPVWMVGALHPSTTLSFHHIHRRPVYYVFNLVVPKVILALLSAFVFIIPADSGEKISYAITILLAFFIFLLLLSDTYHPHKALVHCSVRHLMMTSSNGIIFCVTGPLCGEFTGYRWIPLTKASDEELWYFLWSAVE